MKSSSSRPDFRTWILHGVLFVALLIMQLIGLAKAAVTSLRGSRPRSVG